MEAEPILDVAGAMEAACHQSLDPSYASFSDPDGNGWVFQEVTARLTGHIEPGDTSFTPELANVVRRAQAGRHRGADLG